MIEEFTIEPNANGEAAGIIVNDRPPALPRRGRRAGKARRNTSITTASSTMSTSTSTGFLHESDDDRLFSDVLSDGNAHGGDSLSSGISTEVGDSLYFEEIEKLLDATCNVMPPTTTAVNIAAKLQARLVAKHLKKRRLRRVVSYSAATSLQDDVDMLNNETAASSSSGGGSKIRTVLSFGDMRRNDAEEERRITDQILGNILEEGDEDEEDHDDEIGIPRSTSTSARANAVFDEFVMPRDNDNASTNASIDQTGMGSEPSSTTSQKTLCSLEPHPKMATANTNTDIGSIPFFPPPQPGGLRRANTSTATYAANTAAGRAMLATPSPPSSTNSSPRATSQKGGTGSNIGIGSHGNDKICLPPKPKVGQLRRAQTDSIAQCGGNVSRSKNSNNPFLKEVSVTEFYNLIKAHQAQP